MGIFSDQQSFQVGVTERLCLGPNPRRLALTVGRITGDVVVGFGPVPLTLLTGFLLSSAMPLHVFRREHIGDIITDDFRAIASPAAGMGFITLIEASL